MSTFLADARELLRLRAALGGLGEVPPPASSALADVASFAAALGIPYRVDAADAEASTALLLGGLEAELQALCFALATRRKAQAASDAALGVASLETEFLTLCRAMAIPPPRADAAAAHPEKVLAQVSGGGGRVAWEQARWSVGASRVGGKCVRSIMVGTWRGVTERAGRVCPKGVWTVPRVEEVGG